TPGQPGGARSRHGGAGVHRADGDRGAGVHHHLYSEADEGSPSGRGVTAGADSRPRRRYQSSSGRVTSGGIAASTASSKAHIGQRRRAPATMATARYSRKAPPWRRPNSQTTASVLPLTYFRYMPTSRPAQVKASIKATMEKSRPAGDRGRRCMGGPGLAGISRL